MPSAPLRGLKPAVPVLLAAAIVVLVGTTSPGQAAAPCALYASTAGNDSSSGTQAAPFRTVQKLVDSLSAGKTGCLAGGTAPPVSRSCCRYRLSTHRARTEQ